jgi:hypothetical protein
MFVFSYFLLTAKVSSSHSNQPQNVTLILKAFVIWVLFIFRRYQFHQYSTRGFFRAKVFREAFLYILGLNFLAQE